MAEGGSSVEFSGSLTTLPPPRTRIFKIIVIGDSGVGKTCLTYRFCAGKFPEKTEATIGVDFRERLVEIDGEKIKVCTADTGPGRCWGGRGTFNGETNKTTSVVGSEQGTSFGPFTKLYSTGRVKESFNSHNAVLAAGERHHHSPLC